IKTTLGSMQRSLQIQEDSSLQAIPRPFLQLLISLSKGFFCPLEIEPEPAGVADEGPGPCSEVRDPLGAIASAVEMIGETERQQPQMLAEGGVLDAGFEA